MGGVADFVGDVVGGAADVVGDVIGGAADVVGEAGDFIGDIATEAKEIVLETPYVADVISIAYPPAAPYLQSAKAVNAAANGDWLTAGLSSIGAYKGFNAAGQTSTAGMYEVWDDDLGEWVSAADLPSNWDFGTAGNLTTARNIATGNTLTTSFSNLESPQVMSQIDSTFSQALGGGLANAGVAPTGTDPTKWSAGEWLSDTTGFGSADQWNQLGRLATQVGLGYLSQQQAQDIMSAQQAAAGQAYEAGMPFSVVAPGGNVAFNEMTRTATLGLSPEMQQLYGQALGQASLTGGLMTGYYPQVQALGQEYLGRVGEGLSATEGLPAVQRQLMESELGRYEEAMGATAGYTPTQAGIASDLLGRSIEQGQAITAYDPATAASQYYEEFIAPDLLKSQERERLALENRLLSQGMLGSTGGALRAEALGTAQEQSQRAARGEAFAQAQTMQDLMRQRQMADIQTGTGLMTDIYGRGTDALAAGTGLGANIMSQTGAQLGLGTGLFGDIAAQQQQQIGQAMNIMNVPVQYAGLGTQQAATLANAGQGFRSPHYLVGAQAYGASQMNPWMAGLQTIGGLFG